MKVGVPMNLTTLLKRAALVAALALGTITSAQANPGCVGKMWNPLTDLDYRLMGGIKVAGFTMMKGPEQLGSPPEHKAKAACACKDGLQSGVGVGMTFWMPSYINDMARQAGCIGFLGGINILKGFISESSGQEYNFHDKAKDGVTNMQIHWAYADVTALAGKSLFERCNAVTGAMSIAYMTEPDFVFQNDVYSVVMTPQAAILASAPILSQMTCGMESMANTLGDWQDWGVCAWKGSRMPLSGNAIAKDSAQVTNMDITVKYLTRSALLGTTLRTMGKDATCKPVYSAFYDPFQHRYQWSYPNKVSTRYNVDVVRWGLFVKDSKSSNIMSLADQAGSVTNIDPTNSPASSNGPALGLAEQIVARLPKPLNYPSREAGYMQVWEARQCCMMVLTIENVIKMVIENIATGGSATFKMLYDYYNMANTVYTIIQDPVGAALGFIGDGIADALGSAAGGITESLGNLVGPKTCC
jgi:TraU protein